MASTGAEANHFLTGCFSELLLGAAGDKSSDSLANLTGSCLPHALQHPLSSRMHRHHQGNIPFFRSIFPTHSLTLLARPISIQLGSNLTVALTTLDAIVVLYLYHLVF